MRLVTPSLLLVGLAAAASGISAQSAPEDRTTRAVRRELVLLPRYGVFDHLAFKIEKGTVTLLGQVRTASLKADAERVLDGIEGVETVVNEIEILPTSPGDDRIRLAAYRAIYRNPSLERYAILAVPPVHIIVKSGNITLEGIVDSKMDKVLASTEVRSVPGVFSVTDNLRVENP